MSTIKKGGAPVFSISSSQATNNVNPTKVKVSYLEWSWLSKDKPENIYLFQNDARGYQFKFLDYNKQSYMDFQPRSLYPKKPSYADSPTIINDQSSYLPGDLPDIRNVISGKGTANQIDRTIPGQTVKDALKQAQVDSVFAFNNFLDQGQKV